jgi:hypothetical protein
MIELTLQHIRLFFGGIADDELAARVKAELDDRDSPVSHYCAWLHNPPQYVRKHSGPPALVLKRLAALPAETVAKLDRLADNLPGEWDEGDNHPHGTEHLEEFYFAEVSNITLPRLSNYYNGNESEPTLDPKQA